MRILGIDASTPTASVAILENGELVVEEIYPKNLVDSREDPAHRVGNHAEIILPLIQLTLEQARIALADLSGIALSIGPGSFTGLRISLATVKGIAYGAGLPVVGISTLHANAARVTGGDGIICALLDARKHEVYAALFQRHNGSLKRLSEDTVLSIAEAMERIRILSAGATRSLTIVGPGAKVYEPLLAQRFGKAALIAPGSEFGSVAAQVAALSWDRFCAATTDALGALTPYYLRASEAESSRARSALTC